MDLIQLNEQLLKFINNISINIGLIEFMDFFPLLKRGAACIKTIHCIIKSYVILGNNIGFGLDCKSISDIFDDNVPINNYIKLSVNRDNYDLTKNYSEELVLAEQLLDIVCICKSKDYVPKKGNGLKRIKRIAIDMHERQPELCISILYMSISADEDLLWKMLNNDYMKVINNIHINSNNKHNNKHNNAYFEKCNMYYNIRPLVDIDISHLEPRHNNNILYKFAKFVNDNETADKIKELIIKRNWLDKQVLINNFESLIGPSDIPNNIFIYMRKFI